MDIVKQKMQHSLDVYKTTVHFSDSAPALTSPPILATLSVTRPGIPRFRAAPSNSPLPKRTDLLTQAKPGDTLHIHYKGSLDDGTVFDSSQGRDPLSFQLGAGQIIPGLDKGVTGMEVGEKRTVRIEAADAYGEHMPERVQAIDRARIPDHVPTEPGTQLQVQTPDGQPMTVVVVEADDEKVVLDANHPQAGQALTFDVELVRIG